MNCPFPKETLALQVEGDLPAAAERAALAHVATCGECRLFLDQLGARQDLLKSLRRDTARAADCTAMRREVMSMIRERRDPAGWLLRLERMIVLGSRQRAYALPAVALLALLSATVLGQMRHSEQSPLQDAPVFDNENRLLRPDGYRAWIKISSPTALLGSSSGRQAAGAAIPASVYVTPSAYRAYTTSGVFPDGTLLVWEQTAGGGRSAADSHANAPRLLASVKDSARFDGGWAFFDFADVGGKVRSATRPVSDSSACRTCHERDAASDHVFTQFYPGLPTVRRGALDAGGAWRSRTSERQALSPPTRSTRA